MWKRRSVWICLSSAGLVLQTVLLLATAPAVGATAPSQIAHWGSFFGNGSANNDELLSPTTLGLPGPVVQVATSNSTQYALLSNGTVYAWGLGGSGELGNGGTTNSYTVAVQVLFPAGVSIASLPTDAMPYNTGMAIDTTGHAWGWGLNGGGELCLGNRTEYLTPVELPFADVTLLSGAGDHALYDAGGTLYACGVNKSGELGDGSTTPSRTPVAVAGLAGDRFQALVTSARDSGALLADGKYFDWGYDGQGQLGDGVIGQNALVPVHVMLPLPVTQVAQGASSSSNGQTLVLLSDGSLRAWGDDRFGQLGDDRTATEAAPVEIFPPAGVTYSLLATGANTSYGVTPAGDVYSWGANAQGEIGNGSKTTQLTPVEVETGVTGISSTALDVATS
jgi:alpha-tubulin suppressor-like RCC1 family protein